MKRIILFITLSVTLVVATCAYAGLLSGTAPVSLRQSQLQMPGSGHGEAEGDTLSLNDAYALTVDSIVAAAAQCYKDYIFLRSEGEDYSVLYPKAYECFLVNKEALGLADPKSDDWNRVRNTLIDIDYELESGAYYYSNQANQNEMSKFVQAYIDIQLMPEMNGVKFKRNDASFAAMSYIAASSAYNVKDYQNAVRYFKAYFSCGGNDKREEVFLFMGYACLNMNDYDLAIATMREGLKQFPNNFKLMEIALNACQEGRHGELLQEFLTPAMELRPDDTRLLDLQGKLYEDENKYRQALDTYVRLDALSPNMLSVNKHIALNYYNMAVGYLNESNSVEDEKAMRKYRRLAKDHFFSAASKLEEVVASDPMDLRMLKCLGITYLCLEQKDKFDEMNRQIQALGGDAMTGMVMPSLVSYDGSGHNIDRGDGNLSLSGGGEAPLYSEFAKKYVTDSLKVFVAKNEFEKSVDYDARVNANTIKAESHRLNQEAQKRYLALYANKLRFSEAKLLPYDANNETYCIETNYGPITIKVPLKNDEARIFRSNWEGMKFRSAKYFICDDQVQVASVIVETPDNHTYKYDNAKSLAYQVEDVQIDASIFANINSGSGNAVAANNVNKTAKKVRVLSDVDTIIPVTGRNANKVFALVIANENYDNTADVQSALHDGERFAEYCNKVIGLPQSNITFIKNATLGQMIGGVEMLKNKVNAFNGEGDVIVYYAGHGVPDNATKEAYLLPKDCLPTSIKASYPLKDLYSELNDMNARSTMVFLDACFSGSSREGNALTTGLRAVGVAAKPAAPKGNMFVLSAASDAETAMPYEEKNHGMFTYFLLKKLQETKGNVTLKELSDYVISNVQQQSSMKNSPQHPTVKTSGRMEQEWHKKKIGGK